MEFAEYSISLVIAFAATRYLTEKLRIHLRGKGFWLHHWIIAAMVMGGLLIAKVSNPFAWGVLTGIALEGLRRDNWTLFDSKRGVE